MGLRGQLRHQRRQHPHVQSPHHLALGQAPFPIAETVGQVQPLQQLSAELGGGGLQRRPPDVLDAPGQERPHPVPIDVRAGGVERHLVPVGDQVAEPTPLQQRLQLPQRPAQLRPRIVRRVPEQLRKAFSPMRAAGGHQEPKQGTGFLRTGERLDVAVPPQHGFTEQLDGEALGAHPIHLP